MPKIWGLSTYRFFFFHRITFKLALFISDNHLQLESQMCLHGKKKSLCKRITGFQVVIAYPLLIWFILCFFFFFYVSLLFPLIIDLQFTLMLWYSLQFSPQDPSTVMVTCADSQVRILHGTNVIGKYKGMWSFLCLLHFFCNAFFDCIHITYTL